MTGADDNAQAAALADLNTAIATYVRTKSDQRVRAAYDQGRRAGVEDAHDRATERVDAAVYRRGYQAGYKAGRGGTECAPFGSENGRPRATTAPQISSWAA